ncbi:exonuclease domain-containing protein [Streptomyces mirabilis]|uniref:3'-5' exonuclease n=1 Tax=Streptomyces mirabilis TaxID=68239 RepID=UPI00296E62BD|nr:3'-5' exonuclease [Streptomyces mirabilis]
MERYQAPRSVIRAGNLSPDPAVCPPPGEGRPSRWGFWAQPPGAVSEIIEIGLTVIDLDAGERLARHRTLVRPVRSTVSEFCTELTGLTPHEVDQGISFAEACQLLAAEHRAGTRPWVSWGDYDRNHFTRQCQATRTPYPFGRHYTNAKAVFTEAYGLRKRPGMAQALEIAGRRLEGRHHRGEDDAWNIAALVLHLSERGVWPATVEHPA